MATPDIYTDITGEQVANILTVLDAVKALGARTGLTLWAKNFDDGIAEHALRLWASANGFRLDDVTHAYPADGYTIRTLSLSEYALDIRVQWPSVAIVETREPAPGVVIQLPAEPAAAEQPKRKCEWFVSQNALSRDMCGNDATCVGETPVRRSQYRLCDEHAAKWDGGLVDLDGRPLPPATEPSISPRTAADAEPTWRPADDAAIRMSLLELE